MRDGVPVSWFWCRRSTLKLCNWPNSIQPEWDLGNTKPSQNIQKTSHAIVLVRFYWGTQAYALILKASQGKRDEVPVSLLENILSHVRFANWPNSAGMGPREYKTQSKHTKNKSRYRTGTIWLRNACSCLNIEGKSGKERWSTGKLVFG